MLRCYVKSDQCLFSDDMIATATQSETSPREWEGRRRRGAEKLTGKEGEKVEEHYYYANKQREGRKVYPVRDRRKKSNGEWEDNGFSVHE